MKKEEQTQKVIIDITEYILQEFQELILENSESIHWTFPDENGKMIDIEFIKIEHYEAKET